MPAYVFKTPFSKQETSSMVGAVIASLGGKYKRECLGKWRAEKWATFRPCTTRFYFAEKEGHCNVRAEMYGHTSDSDRFWHTFLRRMMAMCPGVDFGVNVNKPRYLLAVLDLSGNTQQVISADTHGGTSLGGFLVGGFFGGTAGAIVGGQSGSTHTNVRQKTVFSKEIFARLLWNDGLMEDVVVKKNSILYNEIMNMLY